jgi:hypothetical protein
MSRKPMSRVYEWIAEHKRKRGFIAQPLELGELLSNIPGMYVITTTEQTISQMIRESFLLALSLYFRDRAEP